MRISKKMIRERVESLNGKKGYEITVFEKQGLNSLLTVKQYGKVLVDSKSLTNKDIWARLHKIDLEVSNIKTVEPKDIEWTIIMKDYRTEKVHGAFTMYGSEYEVLERVSEIPKKHSITDTGKREVEIYY